MSRSLLRFAPPPLELTPELRWVLIRAFGPAARAAPRPADGAAALAAARRLGMASRIGAKRGWQALATEVGAEAAAGFHRDRLAAGFSALTVLALTRELAEVSAGLGIPLVLLKFAALHLAGAITPGSRAAADLDALVPTDRAKDLTAALRARGFEVRPLWDQEHHLPALVHPERGAVELHLLLPGVSAPRAPGAPRRPRERRFAGYEELAAAGALRPAEGVAGSSSIPANEVLAAHALAHGIAQHGWAPAAYPLMRMLADLVDLGVAGPNGGELIAGAQRWLTGSVDPEETAAARALCVALNEGDLDALSDRDGAAQLLAHVLAGALRDDYRRALKLRGTLTGLTERPPLRIALCQLGGAVFLSRRQIDAIYGPPRSWLGYLGRRLARPFDLAARLLRYLADHRRLRKREGVR